MIGHRGRRGSATHGASGLGSATVAVGFVTSFVVALVVAKALVHYISHHGFARYAWHRLFAGMVPLLWLTER
ncbi:hypothetical protein JMG10_10130 [Nostoc ellipsosporum NOK]|nr:hypothetical protein [Nostoc ellipsosporum NOK]